MSIIPVDNPNTIGVIGAALVTGIFTYIIMRVSKGYDARSTAEAALLGTGPTIIANQNQRIKQLEDNYSTLWDRLHESMMRERDRDEKIARLDRQNSECEGYVRELKMKVWFLQDRLGVPQDSFKTDEKGEHDDG